MLLRKRTIMLMLVDLILVNLAVFLSFYIRFIEVGNIPSEYYLTYYHTAWVAALLYLGVFYVFGLYRRLWQYASTGELLLILFAVSVATGGTVTAVYFLAPMRMPYTVTLLMWFMTGFLVGASRFIWRLVQENMFTQQAAGAQKSVLIVGAGDAGVMAARELKNRNYRDGRPVGFIDDSERKQKYQLMGIPVLGTRRDIPRVVKGHEIGEIIIAIPSASGDVIRELVEICKRTGVALKIMPGVFNMISGTIDTTAIRQIRVEDLLGREPVTLNIDEVAGYLTGEIVLVTGGGGSIGSELCRQMAKFNPQKLIVAGRGENSLFDIEQELQADYPALVVEVEILDVKDQEKVELIFQKYRPQVVFHAAAHKHVPLMERNPEEALKNNVMGTSNLAEAADRFQVKTFVSISTDKAVNPTSVMGATKRIAEMIVQTTDRRSKTRFVAVRFGNVLGSRGSVIPTFEKQIARGGPVTVTHPDMVRYFMTIPEAAQLVVQAGAMAEGGEIFILDMGQPVKIVDLAKDVIRLSGFEPDLDIPIKFTGIRPGEKLYEELLTAEEGTSATRHKRIFVAKPNAIDEEKLKELIQVVKERGSYLSGEEVNGLLRSVVATFRQKPAKAAVRSDSNLGEEKRQDDSAKGNYGAG
ncbi:MAG: polysaccharide biosynthesis protein [Peptococcaceae bacterium]|jgi:FlaA1/EpsC-like NDP-sugar epimerase|nr:polysaccharide biosynthesis protein [Peptococcaceae bacterium]